MDDHVLIREGMRTLPRPLDQSTVKTHIRQILFKLGASDRTQAAILAIEAGLLAEKAEE